jgi:DNA uptake protein ComE-like DNA-binding protein
MLSYSNIKSPFLFNLNMIRQIRSLSIVGLVAGLVALTGCGETTPPVAESPVPSPSVASPVATTTTAPSGPKVDINTASAEELKKLGDKLGLPEFPDKVIANRPYTEANQLVVKQVISPQQFDFIMNEIVIAIPAGSAQQTTPSPAAEQPQN